MNSDEPLGSAPSDPPTAYGSGAPSADDEKRNLMQEVASIISINGGKVPDNVEEFWYQVGLSHQMAAPRGNAAEIARLVLEKLGEEWDDESAEEDGKTPSLLAYETLHSQIKARLSGEEADEPDDDEDSTGALAKEHGQILVGGQDNPIQTIVQFIDDGTFVLDPDWQRGPAEALHRIDLPRATDPARPAFPGQG